MNSHNTMHLPHCLAEIADKITPKIDERRRVDEIAEHVKATTEKVARELYSEEIVSVEYEGSYAKDTWLSGELDLDLFVLFSKDFAEEMLGEAIKKIALKVSSTLHAGLEKRYAAHPYYTIVLDELSVDLVPAYYVESADEVRTPVDRTRLHTRYVVDELKKAPRLKTDIRLLKKLLKLTWIYGAEIEVQGFSGYLAEILVIYHRGLLNLLQEASAWRPWKTVIPPHVKTRFNAPLVVLDPVDPKRNAAAAVSEESLAKFIALSALSVEPTKTLCCIYEAMEGDLEDMVFKEKLHYIKPYMFSITPRRESPPQEIAGISQKLRMRITKVSEKLGFQVARSRVFLCKKWALIIFEVVSPTLPPKTLHEGPPVYSRHAKMFLSKWATHPLFIKDSRWYTVIDRTPRLFTDAARKVLDSDPRIKWKPLGLEELSEKCPEARLWLIQGERWTACLATREKS